tara:strand:+ start:214 stop:678 length:465 start_codon:yes stop_codon:yes gene_type:complete
MNKLYDNMKRFRTKNLTEQVDYKLLASGQATAQQIADTIKSAVGSFNDDEAVMQSAIAAIKDKMQLAEVEKLLGSTLVKWLLDNFAGTSNAKGNLDYLSDYHGNGRTPSIMNSLKRLGILNQMNLGRNLERAIKTFSFKQDGNYYKSSKQDLSI